MDTSVGMDDGTFKQAKDVKIGHILSCYKDKKLMVCDIFTGVESDILHISTNLNASIKVTAEHLMLADNETGVAATNLRVGSKLMHKSGTFAEITSIKIIPYNDKVYNFMFEDNDDGTYFFTNGFYSGCFATQNMNRRSLHRLTPEDQRFMDEMKAKFGYMT
jgi:hypothetical protein